MNEKKITPTNPDATSAKAEEHSPTAERKSMGVRHPRKLGRKIARKLGAYGWSDRNLKGGVAPVEW